ncbi:uncharacterized protein RJT20DRAFT_59699 [Scheffersomyces xylosifermentans]|uniref:uncharacterized protein n=1 Tax=Scheffersomyces xylosifermentans TaxID=1304137 RepID=UPI00315D88CE
MLGRLFKQQPSNSLHNHHHHHHHQSATPHSNSSVNPSPAISSFEDSYAREILYGTHNANQLKPYSFNNKLFRIIISQDGGSLRSKQVLYDSAYDTSSPSTGNFAASPSSFNATNASNCTIKSVFRSKNMVTSKIYHNSGDINDYMFGCGLPTNETNCATKVHVLPVLSNSICGPYNAVLITRLFSISDFENIECILDTAGNSYESSWCPTPTSSIGMPTIKKYPFAKSNGSLSNPNKNNVNSRFAIGIVIPIESANDLNDVIFNNWDEISHYMVLAQKLVYKKLIIHLNNDSSYDQDNSLTSCPYLINKRIQFPNYILQPDHEIGAQLYKLIKLVHYNSNIPKLINSNYLIKSALTNDNSQFNYMLLNWVLEILNWLEFKDGKSMVNNNYSYNSSFHYNYLSHSSSNTDLPGMNNSLTSMNSISNNNSSNNNCSNSTFLASLIALLLPLRKSLAVKPFHNVTNTKNREITRVVIMTGNPVVAKKLIFIINGLIPALDNGLICYEKNRIAVSASSSTSSRINDFQATSEEIMGSAIEEGVEDDEDDGSSKFSSSDDLPSTTNQNSNFSSPSPVHQTVSPKKISPLNGIQNSNSPRKASPSQSTALPISSHPIPIKPSNMSTSLCSSDNSLSGSTTSIKGWEIPCKSAASTTTTTPNKHMETGAKGIPIATATMATTSAIDTENHLRNSSLSKNSSVAYLSSSLNSSSSSSSFSNYSLSKIGGSFMEKWKNSFNNSYTTNSIHTNQFSNSMSHNHFSNGEGSEYVPPPTYGSLSKRNSIQSLRTPSPAIEYEDFSWQTTVPMSSSHSNSINAINSQQTTIVGTPTKLSRTQSMYDLYNMNNGGNKVMNEESYSDGTANISSASSRRSISIKRAKTSVYSPLVDDNLVKNITEHNKGVVKSKCAEIMKLKISQRNLQDGILEVFPILSQKSKLDHYIDIDEADSFVNDQSTITSRPGEEDASRKSQKSEDGYNHYNLSSSFSPVFKHKAQLPNVAFTDEFRPEFNIQSCPVNPKLETQVINSMKNDMRFYQSNYNYESITSRTVFISLRAREIKVLEMSYNNEHMSPSNSTATTPSNSSIGTSPSTSYFPDTITSTGHRNSISSNNGNNYKTIIKKVFTPGKSSFSNQDLVRRVDDTFDDITQLFAQQQNKNKQQTTRSNDNSYEGNDFNKRLAGLVLTLVN